MVIGHVMLKFVPRRKYHQPLQTRSLCVAFLKSNRGVFIRFFVAVILPNLVFLRDYEVKLFVSYRSLSFCRPRSGNLKE